MKHTEISPFSFDNIHSVFRSKALQRICKPTDSNRQLMKQSLGLLENLKLNTVRMPALKDPTRAKEPMNSSRRLYRGLFLNKLRHRSLPDTNFGTAIVNTNSLTLRNREEKKRIIMSSYVNARTHRRFNSNQFQKQERKVFRKSVSLDAWIPDS